MGSRDTLTGNVTISAPGTADAAWVGASAVKICGKQTGASDPNIKNGVASREARHAVLELRKVPVLGARGGI